VELKGKTLLEWKGYIDSMKILRIVLIIAGILSLLNVVILYRISNPNIGFAVQAILSICVVGYAAFLLKIPKKVHVIMGVLCLIPLLLILFLFVYGNVSNVDFTEDVVIVLGAGLRGDGTVGRPLARRLDAAIVYFHQNPEAFIIVTGGLGERAEITEAEASARYLIERGVPEEQIFLEDRSTTTHENLLFAKEILEEGFSDGFSAVLITNDFHVYRAVRTARQVGIDVNRIGAYTDWYTWPVNYLRETLAILNFWFFPARAL